MTEQVLRAVGIRKLFAGVPALDGVDFTVTSGKVVGLVGHNGAGKSTLLKVLSGAYTPDGGELILGEDRVSFHSPAAAIDAGVSTVYQELSLLPNLTIAENTFLGRELRKGGVLDKKAMRRSAQELIDRFRIDADASRRVGEYPVAKRQLLEIAIATSRNAQFLLLDEPTTSLEGDQVEPLLKLVRELATVEGLGIVFINHKLDELLAISDEVVALVNGKVQIQGSTDRVDRTEIVRAIAGSDAVGHQKADQRAASEVSDSDCPVVLSVKGLRSPDLNGVDFEARQGRILGVYGLVGSGRTEFLRTLAGLLPAEAGEVTLFGEPYRPTNPADAQRHGVVYLTEERKIDGVIPGMDSVSNVVLPVLNKFKRGPLLNHRELGAVATGLLNDLSIRGDIHAPVITLSGGNQQKVLLARALAQKPRVLLLDEPTKGVDIGVKSEIHQLLRTLAHEEGIAVVMVSSEEEEILEVSDTVVTFVAGSCEGEPIAAANLTVPDLRQRAWEAA